MAAEEREGDGDRGTSGRRRRRQIGFGVLGSGRNFAEKALCFPLFPRPLIISDDMEIVDTKHTPLKKKMPTRNDIEKLHVNCSMLVGEKNLSAQTSSLIINLNSSLVQNIAEFATGHSKNAVFTRDNART